MSQNQSSSALIGRESDVLVKLLFHKAGVRAHFVRLGESWGGVVQRHPDLPTSGQALLGEMTAAAALLSASLKYDGAVVLQIHGDGPLRLAVAECTSGLTVRATARPSDAPWPDHPRGMSDLVNVHGKGRFSLVLDPQVDHQQPYQGIVSLEGETLAETLAGYMHQSEQIPSRFWLHAEGGSAAGLLLQQMPPEGGHAHALPKAEQAERAESWERLCMLADTLSADELHRVPALDLLHRLFWEEAPRVIEEPRAPRFFCPCSRARVGRMLSGLGRDEIDSILAERQGVVEVGCDFCNTHYRFDAVDCARLFMDSSVGIPTAPGPQSTQ